MSLASSHPVESSARPPCVVYKLGGSLLDVPDLADRLRKVWRERAEEAPLLVVGGGAAADVVRTWDQTFRLDRETSHWLAIEAMDLTASLLLRLMPELQLVRNRKQLALAQAAGRPAILCVACFMKWQDTLADALPHDWSVTSDSIAAAVASRWEADALVLLKSCDWPAVSLRELAATGFVDPQFPAAAAQLAQVTWINLRTMTARDLPS